MKIIPTAIAFAFASVSTGAIAQSYGAMPSVGEQKGVSQDKPAQQTETVQSKIKPSSKATKAILDLQTAVNANNTEDIAAKLAAAQAVATTKEDRYWIARLQLKAAAANKDNAGAGAAIEALSNTGLMPPAELAPLYGALGGTYFNAKQYPQAAAAFEHQIALDPHNTDAMVNLAESDAGAGKKQEAVAELQKAIQATAAAGQKPDEALYRRAVGIAYDAKLPNAVELGRAWIAAYPGPNSWRNTIAIFRNQAHPDTEGTLDLLRLMQATGAMSMPDDYALFTQAAIEQSNYAEAQAVIDAGIAAKKVDPASADFKDMVAFLKAKNKPSASDLDAALKMSPKGPNLLRIGDSFYALGSYAKAADVYRSAKGAAGVDANVLNMHLGMALARAGDKAGATAAFNAVTGPAADIAKFWLIYVQHHA